MKAIMKVYALLKQDRKYTALLAFKHTKILSA